MNDLQFKQLLSDYLAPMLGATLTGSTTSTPRDKLVAFQAPNQIAIKLTKGSAVRFTLKRDRNFEKEESRLAEDFLEVVNTISEAGDRAYFGELVRSLPRGVIARHLKQETTLAEILERLDSWSSETYEGRRITCALGLMQSPSNTGVLLSEYWSNSYAPVLSNGYDTILEIGSDGQLAGLNYLATSSLSAGFAPCRLSSIADWSKEDGRLAATLNTQGEILLFKGGELRFARRAGKWTHVVHLNAVQIMNPYGSKELRTEIYKSCLDASFARTGACIAVVAKENLPKVSNIVSAIDRIKGGSSYKSRLFSLSLDRSFDKIERPLRQELLALDGACVLDYQGNILAVGAIVTVPSGSANGGGRRAAAVALSELGAAIKVSADGPISIFKGANDKPLLQIF
jgi:hypothetical protein